MLLNAGAEALNRLNRQSPRVDESRPATSYEHGVQANECCRYHHHPSYRYYYYSYHHYNASTSVCNHPLRGSVLTPDKCLGQGCPSWIIPVLSSPLDLGGGLPAHNWAVNNASCSLATPESPPWEDIPADRSGNSASPETASTICCFTDDDLHVVVGMSYLPIKPL